MGLVGESEKEAERWPRFEIKFQGKYVLSMSEPWHLSACGKGSALQ